MCRQLGRGAVRFGKIQDLSLQPRSPAASLLSNGACVRPADKILDCGNLYKMSPNTHWKVCPVHKVFPQLCMCVWVYAHADEMGNILFKTAFSWTQSSFCHHQKRDLTFHAHRAQSPAQRTTFDTLGCYHSNTRHQELALFFASNTGIWNQISAGLRRSALTPSINSLW